MNIVEQNVRNWLQNVVIGLNLCPFAGQPERHNTVRYAISQATDDVDLLADLQLEMERLEQTPAEQLETTLLIVPNYLQKFADYNDFLDAVDWLIEHKQWHGVYQVASFHPDYCFAGVLPSAQENLTNRAPYPILHILREARLEQAIAHYPNVEDIPERNIDTMEKLSETDLARLFPYLAQN